MSSTACNFCPEMRCQVQNRFLSIFRMGVDTGAYRRASKSDLAQQLRLIADGFLRPLDGRCIGGEFLTEPHGNGILHVGAA